MAKFPVTARAGFTKMSGVAPGGTISLTPEDSRFLIATGDAVAPTGMVNTVAPAVTGTATATSTLTTTDGTWTGSNGTITRNWQKNHGGGYNDINLATGSTYVLTTADVGATVRCRVRNINGAGPVYANSNATAAVT
jgi:hypothetical protein